eukprot:COSAG02_NODE_34138_length_489_cov_0.664103_1_plen_23_part_10
MKNDFSISAQDVNPRYAARTPEK